MNSFLSDLKLLVITNLKIRYRQTFVGLAWVVINPLILYAVQALLFTEILNQDGFEFYTYLLTGLIPWFYISQTAEMGSNHIYNNSGLLKNLRLHPFKLLLSLSIENYINFLIVSTLIFSFIQIYAEVSAVVIFNYFLFSFWLIPMTAMIAFISSVLNVLIRDTRFILHFIFTILYFLTPTFYYPEQLPSNIRFIINLNPFYWVISLFRINLAETSSLKIVLTNIIFLIILAILSIVLWKKLKNRVYLKL